ncbi:MAG: hypothetical protein GY805_24360 [Chloroflexi bacterium]|nr:hypothetical protein [Chloroflexota bacterium]
MPAAENSVAEPTLSNTAVPPPTDLPQPVVTVDTPRVEMVTAVPQTAQPTIEPTAEPEPTVAQVNVASGRTEEGAFFLGDPNAAIVLNDYSDFL